MQIYVSPFRRQLYPIHRVHTTQGQFSLDRDPLVQWGPHRRVSPDCHENEPRAL